MHLWTHSPPSIVPPHTPTMFFMIIAFNDSLSLTHWHCPHEILAKMAWFTKPLERGKKSHWGDGLLRGLSNRPINHSLIRAPWEWGYTLRPHISTKGFHAVCGSVPELFYPNFVFALNFLLFPAPHSQSWWYNLHVRKRLFS